jgi:hypothetical protein
MKIPLIQRRVYVASNEDSKTNPLKFKKILIDKCSGTSVQVSS